MLSKPFRLSIQGSLLLAFWAMLISKPSLAQLSPSFSPSIPAVPNSRSSPSAYTLGGGDRLRIDILEVPQYSGEYQVLPDGTLTLPLIGSIFVQGLTANQATNRITQTYQRFLKRPIISLSVISPRPVNVQVTGEVIRPGSFTLSLTAGVGDQPGFQYPTVTQAIQQAEGVTLTADLRNVRITRNIGSAFEEVLTLDLLDWLQTGNSRHDLGLRDGDSIYIPPSNTLSLQETRLISSARFAPAPDAPRSISVVGEVTRPGSYVLVGGNTRTEQRTLGYPTVTRAIQQAGGIKPNADLRQVTIRRLTKSGQEQQINVNLWQLLQAGDILQDAVLQDGDTVVVPVAAALNPTEVAQLSSSSFSPEQIQVSVAGEVKNPSTLQLPPNTTLNQAILSAGGFNNARANSQAVDLVRLNPDGTVSKTTIAVDLTQGINERNNPLLRNNDIILVSRSGIAQTTDTISTFLNTTNTVYTFFNTFQLLKQLFGQ